MTGPMPDRDTALMQLGDVTEAIQLLTRLPVPHSGVYRGARAAWAYPLAGLAVGLIGALIAAWTHALPPMVSAGLVLAVLIIATGAMHEDGLADTADGLWGGSDADSRLAIMKDSRIGAFGVLALILAIGLKWAALGAIAGSGTLWPAVLVAAALSRVPMVAVMYLLPNARGDGLSAQTGHPSRDTTLVALGIGAVGCFVAFGMAGVFLVLLLAALTLAVTAIAKRKIGGQTGDILGAVQQLSEIAILVFAAA